MDVTAIIIAIFGGGGLLAIFQFIRDKRKSTVETDSIVVAGADKALDVMREALDVATQQRADAVASEKQLRDENRILRQEIDQLRKQVQEANDALHDAQRKLAEVTVQLGRLSNAIPLDRD